MSGRHSLELAGRDYLRGLFAWRAWLRLGLGDIRIRYKRTVLGPLWITLSMTGTFIAMGMLFSAVYRNDVHHYLPYLAAGMVTWSTLATVAGEGPQIFVSSQHVISSLQLPLPVHVLRCVVRNAVVHLYNSGAALASFFLLGGQPHGAHLLLLACLPLFLATLSAAGLILAIVGARFRDLGPIITVGLQLLFFMTPVIWSPDSLPDARKWWVAINPLYHLIEIVRAPMLGEVPNGLSILVSFASCAALGIGGFVLFCLFRRRIPYWL
jgi:ABC-type polysaccharide/polyol phosphate export permease